MSADTDVMLTAWDRALTRTMVTDKCWIFLGARVSAGYGKLQYAGTDYSTHRLAYEVANGAIPAGMVVDHLCHDPSICSGGTCPHRLCINPDHLGLTTRGENAARSTRSAATRCVNGHEFTAENTGRAASSGHRYCKACVSAKNVYSRRTKRHAETQSAREWALQQGLPVSMRGRLSRAIEDAWNAAGRPGLVPAP